MTATTLLAAVQAGEIFGHDVCFAEGFDAMPVHQLLDATTPKALAAPTRPPAPTPDEVIITGIRIPFGQMVTLLFTMAVAAIPAAILFSVLWFMVAVLLAGFGAALTHH